MRKKPIISLMLTVALLFAVVAPVGARTPEEILADTQYLYDQIDLLEKSGQSYNADVSSVFVDLNQLADKTITEVVYSPTYTDTKTFQIPQLFTQQQAEQKLIQYVLGNIANVYRAEPLNTEISGKIYDSQQSVAFYVYGPHTVQAIDEIYQGVPNCFPIEYDRSSGTSKARTPITYPVAEEVVEKIDTPEAKELLQKIARTAIFTINNTTFALNNETVTMDVSPYLKDNRTYVPVRYLAYAIGVKESDITWAQDTQRVTITHNGTTVTMTIGSKTMLVNDTPIEMDVAPEITDGRTMLPACWLTEVLGADIEWNQEATQATITVQEQ